MLKSDSVVDLASIHRTHAKARFFPRLDAAISFDDDGNALSVFGDWVWDFTPYENFRRPTHIRFPFWNVPKPSVAQISLALECRWLIFLVLEDCKPSKIETGTIRNFLTGLSSMTKFALKNGISLINLLEEWKWLREYILTQPGSNAVRVLNSLFAVAVRLGLANAGITPVGSIGRKALAEETARYRDESMQHPPVPYRILSELISNLTEVVSEFERHSDRYLALLRECDKDYLTGRSPSGREKNIAKGRGKVGEVGESMHSLLCRFELVGYFKRNKIAKDVTAMTAWIHTVQTAVKYLIHIYSGMRDMEVSSLPLDCSEIRVIAGRKHHLISGYTTKFTKDGPSRVRWVTSVEGHQAVECAKKIANCIYSLWDGGLNKNNLNFPRYLFIPVSYTQCASGRPPRGEYPIFGKFKGRKAILRFMPKITEADVLELEKIQRNRDWRNEPDFSIGERWPLTSHQCRRSLAIYAHKSGLVTLPSLRRQLKHITDSMSLFYARGSNYATDFIGGDKKHFGSEWRATETVSAAMSYEKNVLDSQEKMFGGHVHWLKHRQTDESGIVAINRSETLKKFKKGELAYRETVLGGCTSTEHCEHASIELFSSTCLDGCANLAGSVEKLRKLASVQGKFVSSLDANSLEYAAEARQLQLMEQVLNLTEG
jgi:hypothetical protein